MGLFYLLTLYCVIRGRYVAAAVACALGMGCKEVMATAPLIVLLYDRAFLAGSFREALRQRRALYAGLAATWVVLAVILWATPGDRLDMDFVWKYARSQPEFIARYLRLSFWPAPLVVDYGGDTLADPWRIALYGALIGALVAGTVVALVKKPALGFLGAWLFLILAPSSSVFPLIHQTAAGKRMYLPLVAVIVLAVAAAYRVLRQRRYAAMGLTGAVVIALGFVTVRRNHDYRSDLSIWQDTVAKRPENFRARNNLGNALWTVGRTAEAIEQYREALRINPDDAWAHYNLGCVLEKMGRVGDAVAHYEIGRAHV